MTDDPHGDWMVGVSIFLSKTITTPCINQLKKWHIVRRNVMRRTVRTEKDGPSVGGYMTAGRRCNEDVKTRGFVQLNVDTEAETDKETGEVQVLKSAPPFADIRNLIDQFEYVAASTHSHDPARALVKYRITLLPDRDIERGEYRALLEALDALLGGILDRGAWGWSQMFYLPSCPPERAGDAFAIHNAGALLPVDKFIERGRQIIEAARQSTGVTSSVATGPRPIPETSEEIARVQSMLDGIDPDVDRQTWRQVCWAVLATGWVGAEGLIREWSERGEKFAETDFTKVVASFDPTGGTGFGTLVHIARQHGWQDPRTVRGESDIRNGRRFAGRFRDRLLYIADRGDWLIFNSETGWLPTTPGEAERAAKVIVDEMQAEAAERYRTGPDDPKTKRLMAEVLRSSRAANVRAMIDMAKSEPGMSAQLADFDNDLMVIGLQNCIFNLDRWNYEKPTPERKVSKRANVEYDPDAECPRFLKFIEEVQPDPEIRRFLQRFLGYCLTGCTNEQVFVYLHGGGLNGKSTFIELIAWVLGDYAHKISTDMLMSHQRNPAGPSPDIVSLKGSRLVFANETEEGQRLAEARIKDLTGGDTLTGRVPYAKENITFQPVHKLIIAGNHRIEVRDNSIGMWRRVILVPFRVTIPEADRDRHLCDTLKAEGAGVLNWMLAAFWDYKTNGLNVPQAIRAATAANRSEQDLVGEWIADKCVTGVEMQENKSVLYLDYAAWAKAYGYIPLARGRLTRRLTDKGYGRSKDKRSILGIALASSASSMTASGRDPVANIIAWPAKRRPAPP